MATQYDSIEISRLRDYALGVGQGANVPEHEQDVSLASSLPSKRTSRNAETNTASSAKIYTTKVPLKDAAVHRAASEAESRVDQHHKHSANGQHQHPKPPASPSQLPSTIPDSLAARMAAMASQSEGDTQPLSPSVREEFASKIRAHHAERQSDVASENTSNWVSRSHSYQAGETGYINIVDGFEQSLITDTQESAENQDDDMDINSQGMDVHVELFPESRRFQHPTTPATTSRKRQKVESSISRQNTTPRLPTNPFAGQPGNLDGIMNASQAFKATQFTSPLPNILPSDGLSDRPSPDIFNVQRPSTADPVSSPVRPPRSRMTRAVTEPQTTYISIEESQAERERLRRQDEMVQARAEQGASEDDFDSEDSDTRRRRIRRKIDMGSRDVFAAVTAKVRPGSSRRGRGGRRQQTPRAASSRRYSRSESDTVIISDDPVADGNITEDETEREQASVDGSGAESPDELSEENKENFDFQGLRVPTATTQTNLKTTSANPIHATPTHQIRRSTSPEIASSKHPPLDGDQSTISTHPNEKLPRCSATVAIADSQLTHPTQSGSPPQDSQVRTEVNGSSPELNFVPQSQLPRPKHNNPLPTKTSTNPSEESVCVPESSNNPTMQRAEAGLQPSASDLHPSDGARPLSNVAGRLHSAGTPASSTSIRSSPPTVESVRRDIIPNQPRKELASEGPAAAHSPQTGISHPSGALPQLSLQNKSRPTEALQQLNQNRTIISIPITSSIETQHDSREVIPASSALPSSSSTSTRPEARAPTSQSNGAQTGPSTLYETAPSHKAVSPNSSTVADTCRSLRNTISTPSPKKTRHKSMIEIATAASPPDAIKGVDVDVDLMTADDIEYQSIMRGSSPIGPSRKRRRGRLGRVVHVEESEPDEEPAPEVPVRQAQQDEDITAHSVNSARDQLGNPHVTPKAAEPTALSPVQSISKPTLAVETPRKRGRPKKTTPNLKAPAEPKQAICGEEHSVKKNSKVELPRIQTSIEPQGADESSLSSALIVAPNQVFAHFNGTCAAYYPATCIGLIGGEEPQYRVRFDDGTVDVINGFGIKRLELRPGDNVKLDSGGSRKKTYVVVRMQDRQHPTLTPDPETPSKRNGPGQASAEIPTQTDIRGHASVVVSPKQAGATEQQPGGLLTVPIRDVYFTQTMWTGLKDRAYTYTSHGLHLSGRVDTPLERSSIPSTPSSRSHRTKSSGLGPSRSHKLPITAMSSLFDTMVFAVTNIADPTMRTALRNLISNNGGQLLSEDFSELFHIPSLGPASPSKRSPKRDTNQNFHLTTAASRKGFTCLIADKHCRMAKYIQALALGIPCLSSRWVQDCVAKQAVLPWEPYLLAAGESTFLNGAVRSRILPSVDALTANLPDLIEARPKPLANASVLLIMEKNEEETMRSHPLLSHALGARKVSRATSLDAAAKMLADAEVSGESWDWVYSHDKEDKARKVLLGRGKGNSSKKRKRGGSALSRGQDSEGVRTRIVGNEFVIQSLILGRLIDTD